MPTLTLENCVVIVLRPEESKPTVIFASGPEQADGGRIVTWIATQPQLAELLVAALRIAGHNDAVLDAATAAAGHPGSDAAWLAEWASLDASERRRIVRLRSQGT